MTDAQLLISPVPGVELRFAHVNGVRLRYASSGPADGPLVLLVHGWPELWFSWRHQLRALGAAGFRAVAPDCRGYGGSDAPERREAYDCATVCADMVALLRHELLRERAILVGHDWGAILGWQLCLLEPQRFVAYCGMSVPPMFHTPVSPMKGFAQRFGRGDDGVFFYIPYHNETHAARDAASGATVPASAYGDEAAADHGPAEDEYDGDVEGTLRRLYLLGAQSSVAALRRTDAPVEEFQPRGAGGRAGWLPRLPAVPEDLPAWLPARDLAYFVGEYARRGFRGGVNYYRNFERNWRLLAPLAGRQLEQPVMFLSGEEDMVLYSYGGKENVRKVVEGNVANLERCVWLEDTGHWCQQEKPAEVNEALLAFVQRHAPLLQAERVARL